MAVLQMQRISLCALRKDRKPILETLQRRGVVELSDLSPDDDFFQKDDVASKKAIFEKQAVQASSALEVLDAYAPVKASMLAMFEGKTSLTEEEFSKRVLDRENALEAVTRLNMLNKKIAENKAEIVRRQSQLDALEPWLGLDESMRFTGTAATAAFIGSFMEELTLAQIYEKIAGAAPELENVNVDVISTSQDQTCVIIVTNKSSGAALEDALRSCGFVRPASPPKQIPSERKVLLESYIAKAQENIDKAVEEVLSLVDMRDRIRFFMDDLSARAEKYGAISLLAHTKHTFLLTGFVPKKCASALEQDITQKFDASLSFEDPNPEEEDVPVLLSNNGFSSPIESVVASYALPNHNEVDPTFIISLFYYFMFGMMFSDAAYGLIMTLGTGFVLMKYKDIEPGLNKAVKMFFYCGISTTIWGVLFGSYFGDIFDRVALSFFHYPAEAIPIVPATWFVPLNEPMRMLVYCMFIGVIHLFTGLGINGYQCIKQKRYKDFVSNVLVWYLLVGGGILFGLSTDMIKQILQVDLGFTAAQATIFGWIAIIGAVGVVVTNGDSPNIGLRLGQGLYALYNVTGYLSDVLSYSRLLALGLATGVIGSVVNQMGAMGGTGVVGVIGFILVFIVGHSINFGINALGAYVHTNRLQYVEFFGKFYEGGGREFVPFAPHTKYFKF